MSEENVEVVRRCTEALTRALRDPSQFGPYLEFLAPEFEYRPQGAPEDIRTYRRDEIQRYAERWMEDWEDMSWEIDEVIRSDASRVLVATHVRGTSKRTRMPLEMELFELHTVRRGQIVRTEEFQERADAVKAAGLSE